MFNGLNIKQSDKIFRLSCSTYISKILEVHKLSRNIYQSPLSTPMSHDKRYMADLDRALGPIDETGEAILHVKYKANPKL